MEVVISLGVATGTLLAIMQLLMLAVGQSQEAASDSVGAQISTKLMGEIQLMPWDDVDAFAPGGNPDYRFFNEFGEELEAPLGQNDSVFTALLRVSSPTNDPVRLTSTGGAPANEYLRQATVYVAAAPSTIGQSLITDYAANGVRDSRLSVHNSMITHFEKD